jgi:hypothetical protein
MQPFFSLRGSNNHIPRKSWMTASLNQVLRVYNKRFERTQFWAISMKSTYRDIYNSIYFQNGSQKKLTLTYSCQTPTDIMRIRNICKKNYILIFIISFISTMRTAATCHVLVKTKSSPFKTTGQKEGYFKT